MQIHLFFTTSTETSTKASTNSSYKKSKPPKAKCIEVMLSTIFKPWRCWQKGRGESDFPLGRRRGSKSNVNREAGWTGQQRDTLARDCDRTSRETESTGDICSGPFVPFVTFRFGSVNTTCLPPSLPPITSNYAFQPIFQMFSKPFAILSRHIYQVISEKNYEYIKFHSIYLYKSPNPLTHLLNHWSQNLSLRNHWTDHEETW